MKNSNFFARKAKTEVERLYISRKSLGKKVLGFLIVLVWLPISASAQSLTKPEDLKVIKSGIDHLYNFEFSEAEKSLAEIQSKYPGHPIGYLMKAFIMTWKYLPIQENKAQHGAYISTLQNCLKAVEKTYGKNSKNPEAVFFTMASHGYLALMKNYQDDLLGAASEAKKAYNALMMGMDQVNQNPEFYFTTGLYNFYIIMYPEEHPIIKPVVFFFKGGNKKLGLEQLGLAVRKGVITRAEAAIYLSNIYVQYYSDFGKAAAYTGLLAREYPKNPIFRMLHGQSLALGGKFDEAEVEINALRNFKSGFYQLALMTLEGIVAEKRDRKDSLAMQYYLKALKIPKDEQYTREFHALAYAGLARIALRSNRKSDAKKLYKKCLDLTEYKFLRDEARQGMK